MTDYENMTIEELEQANIELSTQRDTILTEQLEINNILDKKFAEKQAQEAIDAMTPEEREAYENALK